MEPRVASRLASFGASRAKALDFSIAPLVRLRLPVGLRVSPRAHLPALPQVGLSSLPEFPLPWLRVMGLPSFLSFRTLRLCRPCVFGLPRILHLRLG